ncbi:hypothetical protein M407DRAFT_31272 [Tulasnella calospora MUT 4182]|uniref:Uncharacterized protein n=1 Tax=Tulasnella calospora MUT 4182 TaxID=1051891 RepID=A0A0C3Q6R6_9AGAM|nr:hypothetical protein M407DRAFT_31272 [Tulasnella calospora MUT 4182]
MADDALLWWSALNEEVQGSWKLLRHALLSKYRSMFYGGSGEEAEKFICTVRDKAIDEGKGKDNEWIVTYATSCLAGEALRWFAYLDSDTKNNWEKLQQALLTQYPRGGTAGLTLNLVPGSQAAASFAPAPKATRRGRIKISSSRSTITHYLSKCLDSSNRVSSTTFIASALELELSISSDGLQTLSIPGSQIPGYDLLGIKWSYDDISKPNNSLSFCVVDSRTNSSSISSHSGDLLTFAWKVSADNRRSDGILTVSAMAGKEKLHPRWQISFNAVWFSEERYYAAFAAVSTVVVTGTIPKKAVL